MDHSCRFLCLLIVGIMPGTLACGSSASEDLFGNAGGAASGGSGGTGPSGGVGGVGGTGGSSESGGVGGGSGDGGACDFGGTWGAYVTIPMTWPATQVLSTGSGVLQVWLLTKRTVTGDTSQDVGQLCGIQLPPFQTILSEQHGVRFLAEAFDYMPEFTFVSYLQGTAFHTDPAPIVFGATLNDPLRDPWPPLASLITADDDRDGRPGVTTPAERGPGYALPLVSFTERASHLSVASRTVAQLTGNATSCDEIEGSVEIGAVDGSPALDSHIVGCTLDTGPLCTQEQAQFADTNGPDFQPAPGSTLVLRRMDEGTTCAQVRGAFLGT